MFGGGLFDLNHDGEMDTMEDEEDGGEHREELA